MHLRRALLLFALVLGLTGLAASIAPPPDTDKDAAVEPANTPSPEAARDQVKLSFRAPAPGGKPVVRRARPESRLRIEVDARRPGQARIPALGRIDSATELVPARFELLAPAPGRYDVLFEPVGGTPTRVGTLVTER